MKTTLAIVFIALVVVSTVAFRHIRDGKYYKHALIVLAATYVLGLLWFTLLSRKPAANAVVILRPRAIQRFFHLDFKPDGGIAGIRIGKMYAETLRNILLFIPFGFLLPQTSSLRSWWKVFLCGIGFSITIEIMQLITRLGCFDVDDVITNLVGTLIGYGMYRLLLALTSHILSTKRKG